MNTEAAKEENSKYPVDAPCEWVRWIHQYFAWKKFLECFHFKIVYSKLLPHGFSLYGQYRPHIGINYSFKFCNILFWNESFAITFIILANLPISVHC